jgi:prepilin-type N-terminal cleavage/methylation domain-containing protein
VRLQRRLPKPSYDSIINEPVHGKAFLSTARPRRAAAFTLVELLTVIAVIAVLASLLMTAIASARKKSRTTVCMFNLHQISLALEMYLDDFAKRPPDADNLVSGQFLPSPRSLLCPEDKTGNWGRLVRTTQLGSASLIIGSPPEGTPSSFNEPVKYSYLLHPLSWDDVAWDRLMQAGGSAGVAACQLHGLGNQDVPDVHSFSGLLLRAQRDGAVVRRRIFWTTEALASGIVLTPMSIAGNVADQYPLQIYLDDPAHWFQSSP